MSLWQRGAEQIGFVALKVAGAPSLEIFSQVGGSSEQTDLVKGVPDYFSQTR